MLCLTLTYNSNFMYASQNLYGNKNVSLFLFIICLSLRNAYISSLFLLVLKCYSWATTCPDVLGYKSNVALQILD